MVDVLAQDDAAEAIFLREQSEATLEELARTERALVYGSTERDTKGMHSVTVGEFQRRLTLVDGCIGSWPDVAAQRDCAGFYSGILEHGLHAAIMTFLQHSRELMTLRTRQPREYVLTSRGMEIFERFDDTFLWNSLWTSNMAYEAVSDGDPVGASFAS